jgi:hypothetical protein
MQPPRVISGDYSDTDSHPKIWSGHRDRQGMRFRHGGTSLVAVKHLPSIIYDLY